MLSQKKWLLDFSVYLLWIPVVALLFWFVLQLRTAIEIGLSAFYVRDNLSRIKMADVIDKYSFAVMICVWIVIIIIIESHLRNGMKKHTVFLRFTRIFGPAVLLLFLVDLFNLLMLGMATAGWQSWLLIAGELLIGGAITYYGFVRLGHARDTGLVQS
jgi:hypothetical protein